MKYNLELFCILRNSVSSNMIQRECVLTNISKNHMHISQGSRYADLLLICSNLEHSKSDKNHRIK